MSHNQAHLESLHAAAWRVVQVMKAASPNSSDQLIYETLCVAAGIFLANAVFPEFPRQGEMTSGGALLAMGVLSGRDARMKSEKESCQGAA
jgi:hypothetical protein